MAKGRRHARAGGYRRVVLKLSGEVLGGPGKAVIDVDFTRDVLGQVKKIVARGVRVGIVVGGGNILRGSQAVKCGLGRVSADWIGMLGTIANGIAIRDIGKSVGLDVRVMSCVPCPTLVEPYAVDAAKAHLEAGRVVVFVGGTGNPFLTTDTAAAIRAAEVGADAVLKATKVDGVYSADPARYSRARRFKSIAVADAISRDLAFMDKSALCLCSEAAVPIVVFDIFDKDSIVRVVAGERIGTIVAGVTDGG
jgi:uridylate kinase